MYWAKKLIISTVFGFLFFAAKASGDPAIQLIENKGQWHNQVLYGADIPGGNMYLRKNGITYLFYDTEALHDRHIGVKEQSSHLPDGVNSEGDNRDDLLAMHVYNAEFIGAATKKVAGGLPTGTRYNYFYGNDPAGWVNKAKGYGKVIYQQLYPGIDMVTYSQGFNMKYDMIVKEGGDPADIRIRYTGLNELFLSGGSLHLKTSVNTVQEYKPVAYQMINGKRKYVACEYVLNGNILSYDFPLGYDPCFELVIDPILIFSTYSGSPADNWGNTATYGEHGKLYSGGTTNHFRGGNFLGEFPATEGAYQTSWGGIWDVAILKYDSSGMQLEYATYLGGSESEVPLSMIMNSKEELVILGVTNSTDFPITTEAWQNSFAGGQSIHTILGVDFDNGSDMFIAKLSKDGSQLTGSTYFGGSGNDGLNDSDGALTMNYGDEERGEVFIDDMDNIYISGSSGSSDLFTNTGIPSFRRNYGGGETDAVVAKFSPDVKKMIWGGYLGGILEDAGFALKVDDERNVYATGGTRSFDFPAVGAGYDLTHNGDIDGWVALIANAGNSIVATTFLGTSSYDQAYLLDLDANEDVYILGQTTGNYPVSPGVYNNPGAGQFIHKLSHDLSQSIFSTTFGTPGRMAPNISPTAFLVNDCDNMYVAGWGNNNAIFRQHHYLNLTTDGLPTTPDALRTTTEGQDFYLLVLDSDATSLLYATFFGGSQALVHVDGGTSRFDKRGIVYHSVCASCLGDSSFPTTEGAWSRTNNANGGCNNAAFKFDLASLRARLQTNSPTFDQPGITKVCMPDDIVFQNRSIGGERYEWDFGDGTSTTKTDTAYIVHNYKLPGSYKVTLKAIDPNTCIGEDITSVTVNVFQPYFTVSDDADICYGSAFQLKASGGTKYEWVSKDSTFISAEESPKVTPKDTTTYYVTITDFNGCSAQDTVVLNVVPEVAVNFDAVKIYDCFSRPPVKLTNTSEEGDSFYWDLGDGNTSDQPELIYQYDQDGTYDIRLVGTRDFCAYEKRITMNVVTIKVPNVLTPSVEGHNDTFIIEAGTPVNLKLFNRWGRLLYENKDYQNDWNGEGEAAGIYYYEATIQDETVCKGWVHLIK